MRACPLCCSPYDEQVEFCGRDGTRLIDSAVDLLIGKVVDRYRIVELLGRGGMGSVYRGTHMGLDRDFALKVIHGTQPAGEAPMARFHREAIALSKIRHTNIVSVVDFVTTEAGLEALVMDFLPGRALSSVIAEEAPLHSTRTASIVRQIALGLGEAHRQGIIHRDVKPSNVLLVREGEGEIVKILDFGIVALRNEVDGGDKITHHGLVLGTPAYMAPEQTSASPLTPSCDLYALGIVAFEMLTGKPPFRSPSIAETLLKHLSEPIPPMPASRGLEDVVARLLSKNPGDRPGSAEAVVSEIDRLAVEWGQTTPIGPFMTPGSSATRETDAAEVRASTLLPGTVAVPRRQWTLGWAKTRAPVVALALAFTLLGVGITIGPFDLLGSGSEVPLSEPIDSSPASAQSSAHMESPLSVSGESPAPEPSDPRVDPMPSKAVTPARSPARSETRDRIERRASSPLDCGALITKDLLDRKLDRLLAGIRGSNREVPENLLLDVDNRYLELRVAVSDVDANASANSNTKLARLCKRISRLETELFRLRRGGRGEAAP